MTNYFYSHLVSTNSILDELESLEISDSEKQELMDIAHMHMHQTIIEAILSELDEDDKNIFLEHLTNGDDEKIWKHLNEKVENIEAKIKNAGKKLEKDLKEDIKKTKKNK